eukprot:GHVQ01003618.1.p1 GENE.GHVQ01003618.1~~GHVQ01003618.1.p1  ORF type:complete len:123 (-),score=10.62 GHVQ01003618.1:333-701(-)
MCVCVCHGNVLHNDITGCMAVLRYRIHRYCLWSHLFVLYFVHLIYVFSYRCWQLPGPCTASISEPADKLFEILSNCDTQCLLLVVVILLDELTNKHITCCLWFYVPSYTHELPYVCKHTHTW